MTDTCEKSEHTLGDAMDAHVAVAMKTGDDTPRRATVGLSAPTKLSMIYQGVSAMMFGEKPSAEGLQACWIFRLSSSSAIRYVSTVI